MKTITQMNLPTTLLDNCQNIADYDKETILDIIVFDHSNSIVCLQYEDITIFKKRVETLFKQNEYKYTKLKQTLVSDYNPIENYDKWSDIVTATKNGKITNTPSGTTTQTIKETSFDSSTQNESSSNTTSFDSYKTETSFDNNVNTTFDGKTVAGNNVVKNLEHTHGNIGVTTAAQMLESERQLALFDLSKTIAEDIINVTCLKIY